MKIKIKRKLQETSGVGGVAGFPGGFSPEVVGRSNKEEEEASKLKGDRLEELLSTSTQRLGIRLKVVSGEKAHAGHLERSQHQGLRNVVEDVDELEGATIDLNNPDAPEWAKDVVKDKPEEAEETTAAQEYNPFVYKEVLSHGYQLQDILGSGYYGTVFSAEDIKTGGDYVIKVVGLGEGRGSDSNTGVDRELRNYSTISQAASTDEAMWKHFPEVYETWKKELSEWTGLGFIVMEKLVPLTDAESAFVPDLNYVLANKKLMDAADMDDYEGGRDQSLKAKWFLNKEGDLLNLSIDAQAAIEFVGGDVEFGSGNRELDDLAASVHQYRLSRYEKMQDSSPEKIDALIDQRVQFIRGESDDTDGYKDILWTARDYYSILKKEVTEAPYALLILLDLMVAIIKASKIGSVDGGNVRKEIQRVATGYINGIRKTTTIPISLNQKDVGRDKKYRSAFHAAGADLFHAIQLLHKKTGLIPRDVHNENVMKREGSGDIVIVDVGLFKLDKDWSAEPKSVSESRKYRIKVLTSK